MRTDAFVKSVKLFFSSQGFKRSLRFSIRLLLVSILLFIFYHIVSLVSYVFIRHNVRPILTQAYTQFNNGNIDSALVLFEKCNEGSNFIGGDFYASESNYWIAKCLYLKSKNNMKKVELHCLISIRQGKGGLFWYSRNLKAVRSSYYLLAKFYLSVSNFEDAKKQYLKALEVSEKYKDIPGMMESVGMYGEFFIKLNNWYSLIDIAADKLGKIEEKKAIKHVREIALLQKSYYYFFAPAVPYMPNDVVLKMTDSGIPKGVEFDEVYKNIDRLSSYAEILTIYALKDKDNPKLLKQAIAFQTKLLKLIDRYPDRSLFASLLMSTCELYLVSGDAKKTLSLLDKLETEDSLSDLDWIKAKTLRAKSDQILGNYETSLNVLEKVDSTAKGIGFQFLLDSLVLTDIMDTYHNVWIDVLETKKDTVALYKKYKELVSVQTKNKVLRARIEFLGAAEYITYFATKYQEILKKEKESMLDTLFLVLIAFALFFALMHVLGFAFESQKENSMGKVAAWILSTPFVLKNSKTIKLVDIVYIQKKKNTNQIIFHLKSGEKVEEYNTLDELELGTENFVKLPKGVFIRTHQSFIINKSEIAEIPTGRATLKMTNGDVVPVSREKKKSVFDLLDSSADLGERAHAHAPKWYRFINRLLPKDPHFFPRAISKVTEFGRWIFSRN